MVLLAAIELVVRRLGGAGIAGTGPIVQHLTLWLGFLGAAVAAREGRLLSLALPEYLPEGRLRRAAGAVGAAFGAAAAALLAVAATAWPDDLQAQADEVEAKLRDLAEALDGLDVAVVGPAVRAAHGAAHDLDHDAFTFIAEAIGLSEDGHEAEATPMPEDGMGDMDQTPAGG